MSASVSFTSSLAVWFEENLYRLPATTRWDRFAPGEDCVAYAMAVVGDAYPAVNTQYKEKTTDAALTQMCFYGIGAHRLYRATMPTTAVELASGDWVVRTNMLAELPVREGLDSYGGDCYFDYDSWVQARLARTKCMGIHPCMQTVALRVLACMGMGNLHAHAWHHPCPISVRPSRRSCVDCRWSRGERLRRKRLHIRQTILSGSTPNLSSVRLSSHW